MVYFARWKLPKRRSPVSPYPCLRFLVAALLYAAAIGPMTAQAQEPHGQAPSASGQRSPRTPVQDQAPSDQITTGERPSSTAPEPSPQCAAQPQCAQGTAAVCTNRGLCQKSSAARRPERGCLSYSCIATALEKGPIIANPEESAPPPAQPEQPYVTKRKSGPLIQD